jgi:hypothetical protein
MNDVFPFRCKYSEKGCLELRGNISDPAKWQRRGKVIARSAKNPECYRVVWDGTKTAQVIHATFIMTDIEYDPPTPSHNPPAK